MSGDNQCNCSNTPRSTYFGAVATSGVQDVSAILPLLGTEQCERHIDCAMERGFFYVAGTPISIFGSLGIVKAGFTALWASLDVGKFHGPRQLRNAGFYPTGIVQKLTYEFDTDDSIYVAENRIRNILHQYRAGDVKINLSSWPWIRWNLAMVFFTTVFSGLGFLPYIHIIIHDVENRSFVSTWMYPTLRAIGCSMSAIMVQCVVQLRILYIIHSRVRFMAISRFLEESGKLAPGFWNADVRSEECLLLLKADMKSMSLMITVSKGILLLKVVLSESEKDLPEYLKGISKANELTDIGSFVSFSTAPNDDRYRKIISLLFPTLLFFFRFFLFLGMAASVIGYVGCFSLIQSSENNRGPLIWLGAEVGLCFLRLTIWASNPGWDDPPPPIALRKVRSKEITQAHGAEGDNSVTYDVSWTLDDVTADDMHALIIGIGEVASNALPPLESTVLDARNVVAYLKDDLAVPERQITLLTNQAATASAIIKALGDLAMNNDVRRGAPILIFIAAHSNRVELLTDHDGDPGFGSRVANLHRDFPSELAKADVKLVTYDYDGEKNTGLSYAKILDILQMIAASKGDNITLILDTCYSADIGINDKFDRPQANDKSQSSTDARAIKDEARSRGRPEPPMAGATHLIDTKSDILIGYPTHILLAACSNNEMARKTAKGGIFTRALLNQLTKGGDENRSMTYRRLIEKIREDGDFKGNGQTPQCSGIFQNRLLFNGLLHRKHSHSSDLSSPSVILISTHAQSKEEDV